MNYNYKNNLMSLRIACCLFIVSIGIFIVFINSSEATKSVKNKNSKVSSSTYYRVENGEVNMNSGLAKGDGANNFEGITVYGTLKDDLGILDFEMINANMKTEYREDSNDDKDISYNEIAYEEDKIYRVDGGVAEEDDEEDGEKYVGYVYYYDEDSEDDEDKEKKEACSYIKSKSYFEMVQCQDIDNVYTIVKTAEVKESDNIDDIDNNALYKFNKRTHQTKRICDINIHEDNIYINDIACNEEYIFLLVTKDDKLVVKCYDKEDGAEKGEEKVEVEVDINEFAGELVKKNKSREIKDYEVLFKGYEFFSSDTGAVIVEKNIIAEIDSDKDVHYDDEDYKKAFEEKNIKPYVKKINIVSSYKIDDEWEYKNTCVAETEDKFDYVYYKKGHTYVITNENNDGEKKIKITVMKDALLLDQLYINVNKISDATGKKKLQYIGVD